MQSLCCTALLALGIEHRSRVGITNHWKPKRTFVWKLFSVRWLVLKSSMQQTCLTDDFVWKIQGIKFSARYRSLPRLTRGTHLRTSRFHSSLTHKKALCQGKGYQKRSRCHFRTGRHCLEIQVVSHLSSNQPCVPLPEASACGDDQTLMIHQQPAPSSKPIIVQSKVRCVIFFYRKQ